MKMTTSTMMMKSQNITNAWAASGPEITTRATVLDVQAIPLRGFIDMTKRKALIKSLIHFHHRSATGRWGLMRKEKTLKKLRSKIAEPDQYQTTTSL